MLDSFLSLLQVSICNATALLYDQVLPPLTMAFRLYPGTHITMAAHDWTAWKRQIMWQPLKMFFGIETNRLDSKRLAV
ncbi:uncharacterized protein F5147DRAFT_675269 [Suillus discolor]|uniref:Uncharacterized protein n=1 Tax=Suillus discolor TaxID=1912936 RepID=A0A9P7FGM9_9AGAM|nr:uncharacterized protein F5147DRAFT_675269 [Suillus discolor]KAG2115928.1 hypothetical protein F5147DRAFT_675269 [Suillus discolor]